MGRGSLFVLGLIVTLCNPSCSMDYSKQLQRILRTTQNEGKSFEMNKAVVTKLLDHPVNLGMAYMSSCLKLHEKRSVGNDVEVRALVSLLDGSEDEMETRSVVSKLQAICEDVEHGNPDELQTVTKLLDSYITPDLILNFGCKSLSYLRKSMNRDVLARQVRLLLKLTDEPLDEDGMEPAEDIETERDDDDDVEVTKANLGKSFLDLCDARSQNGDKSGPLFAPITGKDIFRVTCGRAFKPGKKVPASMARRISRLLHGKDDVHEKLKDFCRALFRRPKP